jgi:hypothetical protein
MAFTHLCAGLLCGDYCQIDDSGLHPLYTVSHTLMLRSATHNGEWCFDHVSANMYISTVPKKGNKCIRGDHGRRRQCYGRASSPAVDIQFWLKD